MNDSIRFLGTSDGLPSADRHHASLLLRLAGQTFLLDAGEPCSHTLKRMGEDFNAIDAVILTHTHSDHIGGFPMLLQSMWLERRRRPLPVFLSAHAIRPLRQWLRACYLFDELLQFPVQWRPISSRPAKVGGVRLRFFRTTHLDSMPKHPGIGFDAYSVRLDTHAKSVAYSGDIGTAKDLLPLAPGHLIFSSPNWRTFLPTGSSKPFTLVQSDISPSPTYPEKPEPAFPRLKTKFRALRPMRVSFATDGRTQSV